MNQNKNSNRIEGLKGYSAIAYALVVVCGGSGMLVAVAVELIAVAGRMIGLPLAGSIELVQVVVTVAGTAALILATINGTHATVRVLANRLPPRQARGLKKLNALLAALFFLLLCAGSVWLAADLWFGFEETEIWQVSYRPLRMIVACGTLVVAGLFIRQIARGAE